MSVTRSCRGDVARAPRHLLALLGLAAPALANLHHSSSSNQLSSSTSIVVNMAAATKTASTIGTSTTRSVFTAKLRRVVLQSLHDELFPSTSSSATTTATANASVVSWQSIAALETVLLDNELLSITSHKHEAVVEKWFTSLERRLNAEAAAAASSSSSAVSASSSASIAWRAGSAYWRLFAVSIEQVDMSFLQTRYLSWPTLLLNTIKVSHALDIAIPPTPAHHELTLSLLLLLTDTARGLATERSLFIQWCSRRCRCGCRRKQQRHDDEMGRERLAASDGVVGAPVRGPPRDAHAAAAEPPPAAQLAAALPAAGCPAACHQGSSKMHLY